jgi:hypothetical protein
LFAQNKGAINRMGIYESNGIWYDESAAALIFMHASKRASHLKDNDGNIVAKKCTPCGQMLTLDNFGSDKRGLAGKRGFCKECDRKRQLNNDVGLDIYGNPKKPTPTKVKRVYNKAGDVIAKVCPKCEELKVVNEFHKHPPSSDGVTVYCKPCHREYGVEWVKANPDKVKTNSHNRRAKEKALPGDLTDEQWIITLEYFDHACALTGETNPTLEHAIPIDIGHGGTTHWNSYPLSGPLNSSKSATNIFEWRRKRNDIDKRKFNSLICYLADQCELTVDEYIEFYNWCFKNPRLTVEEIEADGDKDSLTLWRESKSSG